MRLAAAGQLDAGFASLATFALQVVAVRIFTVEQLGAFGLVFSAFVLATQIPNQLLLNPLEVLALEVPEPDRVGLFRHSIVRGAVVAFGTGLLVPLGLLPVVGDTSDRFLVILGSTAAIAAVFSPLQDHIRKVLHLSGRSERAALVSGVQLIMAVGSVLVIAAIEPAAAPFGALVIANVTSSAVGIAASGIRRTPRLAPSSIREAWSLGRWLLIESISSGFLSYASVAVIAGAAGAATMGAIEGARIVARPIQVASQGLVAIVSPRAMTAGRERNRPMAYSWRRRFYQLLTIPVLLYAVLLLWEPSRSQIAELLPNSFAVENLAVVTAGAVVFSTLAQPLMAELSGALRQSRLALWSVIAMSGELLVAIAFVGIGAFVYPIAVATSGVVRTVGLFRSAEQIYRAPQIDRTPG